MSIHKIILVGAGSVGKSSFVRRCSGRLDLEVDGEEDSVLWLVQFKTSDATLIFEVIETNDTSLLLDTTEGIDGIILMFDRTDKKSFEALFPFYTNVIEQSTIPFVICGNKADASYENSETVDSIDDHQVRERIGKDAIYYSISAKSKYKIEMPFLFLAKALTGNDDITFISF